MDWLISVSQIPASDLSHHGCPIVAVKHFCTMHMSSVSLDHLLFVAETASTNWCKELLPTVAKHLCFLRENGYAEGKTRCTTNEFRQNLCVRLLERLVRSDDPDIFAQPGVLQELAKDDSCGGVDRLKLALYHAFESKSGADVFEEFPDYERVSSLLSSVRHHTALFYLKELRHVFQGMETLVSVAIGYLCPPSCVTGGNGSSQKVSVAPIQEDAMLASVKAFRDCMENVVDNMEYDSKDVKENIPYPETAHLFVMTFLNGVVTEDKDLVRFIADLICDEDEEERFERQLVVDTTKKTFSLLRAPRPVACVLDALRVDDVAD